MTSTPSAHAINQYATTTGNLTARIALHAYSTNPQDWFSWLDERLPLAGDVLEVGAGTTSCGPASTTSRGGSASP